MPQAIDDCMFTTYSPADFEAYTISPSGLCPLICAEALLLGQMANTPPGYAARL